MESKWIHWGIWVNLLRNLSEFIEESEWIHGGIWVNLLRNQIEFIEESEWIYWGIWVNLLRNPSEFINSNRSVEFKKKIIKWLKNSVLARWLITLVLVVLCTWYIKHNKYQCTRFSWVNSPLNSLYPGIHQLIHCTQEITSYFIIPSNSPVFIIPMNSPVNWLYQCIHHFIHCIHEFTR